MEEYYLSIAAIGKFDKVLISRSDYHKIIGAKETLQCATSLERKYEIIIRNYNDFEKALLDIALGKMLSRPPIYKEASERMLEMNTRIMNLLSSSRSYIDQTPKDLKDSLPDDPTIHNKVKDMVSNEKKVNTTFKFVESLRNHIQHYGLPVHNFSSNMQWDEEFEHMEHQCLFFAAKETLAKDNRFNKKALREQPDEINLIQTIRLYIESVSILHENIRKIIRDKVNEARAIIEGNIKSYVSETKHDTSIGVSAMHASDGRLVEHHSLLLEWDNVRIDLEHKNQPLINLHKRHVTNRADTWKKQK